MSRIIFSLWLFLILSMPQAGFGADKLNLYLSEIPGQSMQNDNEPGMALELIRKITQEAEIQLEETFLPWPRAVLHTQKDEKGMIAPFSRTSTREEHYQWIGELYDLEFGFVSLDQAINDKTTAKRLGVVGVWRGSSMEEELVKDGFENLHSLTDDKQIVKLLGRQRLDAWYGSLIELRTMLKGRKRIGERHIMFGAPVRRHAVWLASNSRMDDKTVRQLRAAIETLRSNGEIDAILKSYGQSVSDP